MPNCISFLFILYLISLITHDSINITNCLTRFEEILGSRRVIKKTVVYKKEVPKSIEFREEYNLLEKQVPTPIQSNVSRVFHSNGHRTVLTYSISEEQWYSRPYQYQRNQW